MSIAHGLSGPLHSVSTACATGAHSIGDAFRFVKYGDAVAMVAGGTESSFDLLSLGGFSRMRALSTGFNGEGRAAEASRPFDSKRDGFVMGEGAGVVVLEELEHAKSRGAAIYGEVTGYGMSGDAFHVCSPSPGGEGPKRAMGKAMAEAGVEAEEITYVNAHATGTPMGDGVECRALGEVFRSLSLSLSLGRSKRGKGKGKGKGKGNSDSDSESDSDSDSDNNRVMVSSTKGHTGHLLGAAGAVEAIFAIMSLKEGRIAGTRNLQNVDIAMKQDNGCDEGCDFDPEEVLDLVKGVEGGVEMKQREGGGRRSVMSNSFGFGGTNCALVFSEYIG